MPALRRTVQGSRNAYIFCLAAGNGPLALLPAVRNELLYGCLLYTSNLVSTLIVEPAQFHGGGVYAPMEYFKGIREICDEYGIVFVADEIAIGMGRTGKWWCIEHYGVTPDLITTSKALSGGVWPLSAVLGKREIMEAWAGHPDKHMGTWHGSAIGCKAATTTIREIKKQNLLEAAAKKGAYFKENLQQLQKEHTLIGSCLLYTSRCV